MAMSCRGNLINTVNGSHLCGCTRGVYRGCRGDWWNRPSASHQLEREQVGGEQYHGDEHACGLGELGIIRMLNELMYFSPSSSGHTPRQLRISGCR